MATSNTDYVMTPADALKFIRKQSGTLFIACGQHAPLHDNPGHVFPVMGNVEVSRRVALKFVTDTYSETLAARGAMVRITVYNSTAHTCTFIGSAA